MKQDKNIVRKKPDFMIIGVAKGGTTVFADSIGTHPEIDMVRPEQHFFNVDKNYEKGIADYEQRYGALKANCKIIGGKTPDYCFSKIAMDRIHEHYQDIKLILLLRNPITRAYSNYNMNVLDKNEYRGYWDYCNF